MKVEERFLKYISHCTTSNESSANVPSNAEEFMLAKELKTELENWDYQRYC